MQTFISDISKQSYPISERVFGSSIRECILKEIKNEFPTINANSCISLEELNNYRQQYIRNSLIGEFGELNTLEKTVLQHLENNELISDHLSEKDDESNLSFGQKVADKVASFGGSWKFIILFSIIIFLWMIVNVVVLVKKPFDPYPFILLNLVLSCLAAFQAPVIMMSQNRQEEKDRQRAGNDYMVNLKSEMEIRMLHEKLDHLIMHQQQRLMEIQQVQIDIMNDIMQRLPKQE